MDRTQRVASTLKGSLISETLRCHIPSILLLGIPALVYVSCLGHGFVWDDHGLIQADPWIQDLRHLTFLFSPEYWTTYFVGIKGQYRPVRAVTLALQWAVWGDNPLPFHAFNLMVHLANVWLVYRLLLKLGRKGDLAWLGAMLFALHPMHTEVVVWIKNRSELLSLFFSLASMMAYLGAARAYTKTKRLGLTLASTLSYMLALLSKEIAITVLPIMVAHGVLLHEGRIKRPFLLTLPVFMCTVLYILFKLIFLTTPSHQVPPPLPLDVHVLLIFKTLGMYLWMLLVPVHLNADRVLPLDGLATDWKTWVSVLAVMCVFVVAAILFLRRKHLALFGLVWIIVGLAPVSNFFYQHTRPIADQRLYFPSVGFSLLVGLGLTHLRGKFPIAKLKDTGPVAVVVAIEMLLGLYAVRTFIRVGDWRDDMSLIQDTLRHSPDSPRPHLQMGLLLSHQGDLDGAAREFYRVLELSPYNVDAHKHLGIVLTEKRDFARAARSFDNALRLAPGSVELLYNISIPLAELGRHAEAEKALKRALEISPRDPQILTHWGILQGKMGKFKEAVSAFDQALQVQPKNLKARVHMAYAFAELGDLDRAIEELSILLSWYPRYVQAYLDLANTYHRKGELEKAYAVLRGVLSWNSDDGRVHNALGNILVAMGRVHESVEHFRKAVELSPNHAMPYYNLGRAYLQTGRPQDALDPLRKGLEIEPQNLKIRKALVEALRLLEMNEEAMVEEKRIEALEQGNGSSLTRGASP